METIVFSNILENIQDDNPSIPFQIRKIGILGIEESVKSAIICPVSLTPYVRNFILFLYIIL